MLLPSEYRDNGEEGIVYMIHDHEAVKLTAIAFETCFVVQPPNNHDSELQVNYREIVRMAQYGKYFRIETAQKSFTFKGVNVQYPRAVIESMRAYGRETDHSLERELRDKYGYCWDCFHLFS